MGIPHLVALIVGDVRLYRDGLAQVLRDEPSISVVGTASDPDTAIRSAVNQSPHIVLIDNAMPQALQTAQRIHALVSNTRIIALNVPEDRDEICACAEAGVAAIVMRNASLDELLDTIDSTSKGEFFCSARTAAFLLEHVAALADRRPEMPKGRALTRRQSHILDLLSCGRSNKEIARHLGIEVATVKNHVHQILQRLQVSRRGEAAAMWSQRRSMMTHYPPAKEYNQHFARGLDNP